MSSALKKFDSSFRNWVIAACRKWGYTMPSEEYYTKIHERLPQGLRTALGLGIEKGLIIPKEGGIAFTLKGLPANKGPYHWFSHNRNPKPAPNWEYFVQVAEFIRLHTTADINNLSITFEDDNMDIALYQNDKLIVCCEVKERIGQLQKLIKGIKEHQCGVVLSTADRGNDPLRKAKYIVRRKPEYFIGVAIGARLEYKVTYMKARYFQLVRDTVPFLI